MPSPSESPASSLNTKPTPTPTLPSAPPPTPSPPSSSIPFTAEWLHGQIISPQYCVAAMRRRLLLGPETPDLKAKVDMLLESCDALSESVELQMRKDHAERKEADQKDGITIGGWKDRISRRTTRHVKEKKDIQECERLIRRCDEVAQMAVAVGRTVGASARLNFILGTEGFSSSSPSPSSKLGTNTFGSGITGTPFGIWGGEVGP